MRALTNAQRAHSNAHAHFVISNRIRFAHCAPNRTHVGREPVGCRLLSTHRHCILAVSERCALRRLTAQCESDGIIEMCTRRSHDALHNSRAGLPSDVVCLCYIVCARAGFAVYLVTAAADAATLGSSAHVRIFGPIVRSDTPHTHRKPIVTVSAWRVRA